MSPVIILGLVLMWACVLVPMWLRRHDEAEQERSVDRFSTAMHTLSRREARTDERYVVMPHRTRSMDVHVSGASAPYEAEDRPARAARPARAPRRSVPARLIGAVIILAMAGFSLLRRAVSATIGVAGWGIAAVVGGVRGRERRPMTAATRRRRTLIGLLLAVVVALVAAVVVGGLLLWLLQAIADVALVGFVWHLQHRAQRAAAVARQRRRAAAAPVSGPVAEPVVRSTRRAEPVAEPELPETAEPLPLTAEAGSWDPVPVPRPTYTMKPPAPARPPRTAEYADYSEPLLPISEDHDRDELDDTADLGEILEQRWAVND
jgi:hypothetical protein